MMKFLKNPMEAMDGVAIYPILSFLIVFFFFLLVTYFVVRKDKKYFEEVSTLPLEGDKPNSK
jgi:uncharacterized membrane protein